MPERQGSPPAPTFRALAELRLEGALARSEEIAGRWVIALVGSRPLEDLGGLPLAALARRAPELCQQLIEAVRSDGALERLCGGVQDGGGEAPGAAAGLGELTGARTAAELVDALELLRGVLCEALREEISEPSPRQTADLCERVAHVCAVTLAGALTVGLAGAPEAGAEHAGTEHAGTEHAGAHQDPAGEDPPGGSAPGPRVTVASGARPLIVDELEDAQAPEREPFGSHRGGERGDAIAIRDQRGEHGAAEWLEAIARELERHERQELPFAVVLVELRDLERLRLQSTPARLAADLASLERVLAGNGSVIRERPGRYWVLASGADRRGARALAEHLAAGVAAAAPGEPLQTSIGIAVYPADGRHAAALAAHADVDLIAARAARS